MSQSPTAADQSSAADYFRNWDALGLMLARGSSFSGHERNCVFLNTGNARYADVSAVTGLDFLDDARAVAFADWDHDGDLDIWLANRNAPQLRLMRNELPSKGLSVALRLVGGPSNRDAVGARVEMTVEGESGMRRQIETCRAGTGFLTQSSKWLHFGIGDAKRIAEVRIRWPNATDWETIAGIAAGSRYVVRQGSGMATRQTDKRSNLKLAPGVPQLPPRTSDVRVVLTRRLSVPELEFENFQGEVSRVSEQVTGSATLINLWASWCQPCLQELGEFARHQQQLRDAGIAIVALSTDEVSQGSRESAKQATTALDFPFPTGLANVDLVKTLSSLRSKVFYKETPLPLPCSFLLDRQGRWACYYAGPVKVEQLLEDVQLLDAPRERLDEESFPGKGRFVFRDTNVNPLAVADAYLEGGYDEEAKRELKSLLDRFSQRPVPDDEIGRESLRKSQVDVLRRLAGIAMKSGDNDEAVQLWQRALQLEPQAPSLRLGLFATLKQQGLSGAAGVELERLLADSPQDSALYLTVGTSWLTLGEFDQGIEVYKQGLRLDGTHRGLRFALASALQKAGSTRDAMDEYELLLGADDSWAARANNNLAWLRATHSDSQYRDGQEAVNLARKACQLTGNNNPKYLGTLGSAWAEVGEFASAIEVTRQALLLARDEELTRSLQERLVLYGQSKPYHAPP